MEPGKSHDEVVKELQETKALLQEIRDRDKAKDEAAAKERKTKETAQGCGVCGCLVILLIIFVPGMWSACFPGKKAADASPAPAKRPATAEEPRRSMMGSNPWVAAGFDADILQRPKLYRVLKREDVSSPVAKRVSIEIEVPQDISIADLETQMKRAAREQYNDFWHVAGLLVLAHREGKSNPMPNARLTFAPDGDWGNARDGASIYGYKIVIEHNAWVDGGPSE